MVPGCMRGASATLSDCMPVAWRSTGARGGSSSRWSIRYSQRKCASTRDNFRPCCTLAADRASPTARAPRPETARRNAADFPAAEIAVSGRDYGTASAPRPRGPPKASAGAPRSFSVKVVGERMHDPRWRSSADTVKEIFQAMMRARQQSQPQGHSKLREGPQSIRA
jgi:hypothetical protein